MFYHTDMYFTFNTPSEMCVVKKIIAVHLAFEAMYARGFAFAIIREISHLMTPRTSNVKYLKYGKYYLNDI